MTANAGGCYSLNRRTKGGSAVELREMLDIRPGVTAVIGGGGKTTLLRVLGSELSREASVLLCTTTKILPFPNIPCAQTTGELDTLRREHRLLCAGTYLPDSGKLTAPELPVAELAKRFDYILVEADGAAQRPLKAHAPHEPVIPAETNRTICVVGASGFGRPIAEAVHRPELYASLAGVAVQTAATPETEAAVLSAEKMHDFIYVNQIETAEDLETARRLAALLGVQIAAGSLWKGEYTLCSY